MMKHLKGFKINESREYPGRLSSFFEEQMNSKSYDNIFSLLFQHMDLWYSGYKVKIVSEFKIEIYFKSRTIYTQLMKILSGLEKKLQDSGYNEPTISIDCKKNKIIIEE